jgi:hypothetical protein
MNVPRNNLTADQLIIYSRAIDWADCDNKSAPKKVQYYSADSAGDSLYGHRRHIKESTKVFLAAVSIGSSFGSYVVNNGTYKYKRSIDPLYTTYPADLSDRLPKPNSSTYDQYEQLESEILDYLSKRHVPIIGASTVRVSPRGLDVEVAVPNAMFNFASEFTGDPRIRNKFAVGLSLAGLNKTFKKPR